MSDKVACYYVSPAMVDPSHPRAGWYIQIGHGIPIGPFPDKDRAEAAVEAVEACMGTRRPVGGAIG